MRSPMVPHAVVLDDIAGKTPTSMDPSATCGFK
jgi:hypothetical protein